MTGAPLLGWNENVTIFAPAMGTIGELGSRGIHFARATRSALAKKPPCHASCRTTTPATSVAPIATSHQRAPRSSRNLIQL